MNDWKDSYTEAVKLSLDTALSVQTNYFLATLELIKFAVRQGMQSEAIALIDDTASNIKRIQHE